MFLSEDMYAAANGQFVEKDRALELNIAELGRRWSQVAEDIGEVLSTWKTFVPLHERSLSQAQATFQSSGAAWELSSRKLSQTKQYFPLGVWTKMGYPADRIEQNGDFYMDPVIGPVYGAVLKRQISEEGSRNEWGSRCCGTSAAVGGNNSGANNNRAARSNQREAKDNGRIAEREALKT